MSWIDDMNALAAKQAASGASHYYMPPEEPKQQAPAPQKKQKGRGGFLSSLISEGGALGGAALGTALLPGIGTIIGAGLGGFGGRLTENKVRDNEFRVGQAAGEGALSGALAGLAPAAKAVKGATSARKAGGSLSDALGEAMTRFSSTPGQKLDEFGNRLIGQARGITPGVGKSAVREGLSFKDAKSLNAFLDKEGIKGGSALQQLKQVEDAQTALFDAQKSILSTKNTRLAPGTIKSIRDEVSQVLSKTPGVTITQQLQDDLAKLGQTRSMRSLNEFRQSIDELVNFNRASASPDPNAERLYKILRRSVDKKVAALSPELKAVNSRLNKFYDARDFLQESAKRASGNSMSQPVGLGLPLTGVRLPAEATQSLKTKVGRTATSGRTQAAVTGLGLALPQAAGRLPGLAAPQDSMSMTSPMSDSMTTASTMPPAISNMDGAYSQPQEQSSGYSSLSDALSSPEVQQQLLLADLLDPESQGSNIGKLKTIFDLTASQSKANKPLSAEASKIVSNAQIGLQALNDYEGAISQDPSVLMKRNIPGRGLLGGALGGVLGTRSADAASAQIVDTIARLRTGAAITNDEAKRFETFIPQSGDNPRVAAQKLAYLRNQFEMVANRTGSAGSDTQQQLMGAQGMF